MRVPPAPAAVPVERLVGIGFVGPLTERPVSGVWASSRSRPVPPRRGALFCAPARVDPVARSRPFARAPASRRSASDRFFLFLPFGVFAPAVFLPVFREAADTRLAPAPLRAAARAPAPARLFDGVRFCPFVEPLRVPPALFRFAAFFAMVICASLASVLLVEIGSPTASVRPAGRLRPH
jgi:hypothetical protein